MADRREEFEFPFTIIVTPGAARARVAANTQEGTPEGSGAHPEARSEARRLTWTWGPPLWLRERSMNDLLRALAAIALVVLIVAVFTSVFGPIPSCARPSYLAKPAAITTTEEKKVEERKVERKSEKDLHIEGIPSGNRLVRITDPEKAALCSGRLVRDNNSPLCKDVSDGRWCPNKCEK
jgi:hypothetical protein